MVTGARRDDYDHTFEPVPAPDAPANRSYERTRRGQSRRK